MKGNNSVLVLPDGMEDNIYDDEVIMPISQRELDEKKIIKGDLVLLGMDGHNVSNQLRFVNSILTSKDFPKGTIAEGQCIVHVKSVPNAVVRSGFTIDDVSWKDALTAILVYGLATNKYKWIGYPIDKSKADKVLSFFQKNVNGYLFGDFTDKYGAIWFKEKTK